MPGRQAPVLTAIGIREIDFSQASSVENKGDHENAQGKQHDCTDEVHRNQA
jgi:hypothetical protein